MGARIDKSWAGSRIVRSKIVRLMVRSKVRSKVVSVRPMTRPLIVRSRVVGTRVI